MSRSIVLIILFCGFVIGVISRLDAQTYTNNIPANYSSTLTVPGGLGAILDVNVQLTIASGFEPFTATLTSPDSTTITLFAGGLNTGTFMFDDSAALFFLASSPPGFTYRPQPAAMLSSFNGEIPTGDWILTVDNAFIPPPANISTWGLTFALDTPPVPPGGTTANSPVFRRNSQVSTFYVADSLAINSVMHSALPFGQAQLSAFRQAINTIGPGINARLFRARAGENNLPADTLNPGMNASNSSSLLRYLAFVGDENMSYKVALGLADPEERSVEVNMVDTLSAQTGTNFNGQPMTGGLPYAMMGVPMMPLAGGVATVNIIEAAPSGKTVIDDSKAVIEKEVWNRWELFVAGDFSFYDQDQLTDLMQGFDTDTYAGSVGLEYRALDWLNLGLAWSYLESDTHISGNLGDIGLEGNLISGYATAFWRQYWADILYTYGTFDNDLRRNTGLGSSAHGDTDSDSHNIRLNFGRNFNVGNNIVTGPIAGVRYSMGGIDSYSETGGGRAAVDYEGSDFESMISRLGWQATHYHSTSWGQLVSQAHLTWEHEYMPESGTVGASLQSSPFALVTGSSVRRVGGFSAEDDGAHPGTDWLSAGVGVRFELNNGVALNADYEGVFFRSNATHHYASAKLSYEW